MAGDEGFDPLGLSNINDLGVDLYWLREAELKHARVAMLAFVGLIMQEIGFVAPGFVSAIQIYQLFSPFLKNFIHPIPFTAWRMNYSRLVLIKFKYFGKLLNKNQGQL